MKTTTLNQHNYKLITQGFGDRGTPFPITGTKLQALYTLIQKKGEVIETPDHKLNGVKTLKIDDRQYIALVRFGGESFYPCAIKTYLLEEIN